MKEKRGVTLMELVVVVIIIGILSGLAMPLYYKSKERALDNEASANLKLIRAAEQTYRMEMGNYTACVDTNDTNLQLKLLLPNGTKRSWDYKVDLVNNFTAKAGRIQGTSGTYSRAWCINKSVDEPYNLTLGCQW